MASGSTAAPGGLRERVTALRARSRTSGRFPRVPRSPACLTASSSSRRRDVASHPLRETASPGSLSERSAPAGPATAGRTKQPGRKGGSAGTQGGGRRGKSPPHLPGEGESASCPEMGVFLAPAVRYRRWVPTVLGPLQGLTDHLRRLLPSPPPRNEDTAGSCFCPSSSTATRTQLGRPFLPPRSSAGSSVHSADGPFGPCGQGVPSARVRAGWH